MSKFYTIYIAFYAFEFNVYVHVRPTLSPYSLAQSNGKLQNKKKTEE